MSVSGGGRVVNFRRLLLQKRTSLDFDLFSLRLFSAGHATILSISAALVLTIEAGMTRYVSSANLTNVLSVLRVCRWWQ